MNKSDRQPIRSPWPTAAHPLNLVTDRRIDHYIRRGFYGRAAQERAQRVDAIWDRHKRERKTSARRTPTQQHTALDLSDLY